MKSVLNRSRWMAPLFLVLVAVVILTAFGAGPVQAAEEAGSWRETYDLVMRWVNFIILVAVIVYFGRRPVANLLAAQAERHASRIGLLEQQRDDALQRLAEAKRIYAEGQARFSDLHERIVAMGEQQREELIADARRQAELMIAGAQRRIASALRDARTRLRDEMVDLAAEKALQRLPAIVTSGDNDAFCLDFIDAIDRVGRFVRGRKAASGPV